MNKQILTINSQKIVFSLLAIVAVGFTPISAKADDALIQETLQESYTTGVGNVSVQNSHQQNRQYSSYRDRYGYFKKDTNNTGIVQRSQQLCDQLGEENVCVQNSEQLNTSVNTRSTRHRRF